MLVSLKPNHSNIFFKEMFIASSQNFSLLYSTNCIVKSNFSFGKLYIGNVSFDTFLYIVNHHYSTVV